MRGCNKYKTQLEINKKLQYLYSGEIAARNDSFGEYQIIGFKANMLDNRFSADTDITMETVSLICNLLFNPLLENGVFIKNYTNGEKLNLIDIIESERNNKTRYSISRLTEEMCKNEVFGVSKLGEIEKVKDITPKTLYNAFNIATNIELAEKIILFSPGCSSFDSFDSYVDRGKYFDRLVKKYEKIKEY